jgi:uncharacterized protein (DUF2345 family)
VHATELTEVPVDLTPGPYRDALEIAEARWAEGRTEGKAEGEINARRNTLLRLLARAGIALTDDDRARIQSSTKVRAGSPSCSHRSSRAVSCVRGA